MNQEIQPENANRLAIGLSIQRRIPYHQAEQILRSLTLKLIVNESQLDNPAFQAALLTAFATGNRCFLGGVELQIPPNTPLVLPLHGYANFNDAMAVTGYDNKKIENTPSATVIFGDCANEFPNTSIVECDSWRACVRNPGDTNEFIRGDGDNFALGGVFAGGLAVYRSFLKATGIDARSLEEPLGISLWNPTSDWRVPLTKKLLRQIPNKYWILGLGHLGQAYLWNLALLPFPDRKEVQFLIQDFDIIEAANRETGILATQSSVGRKKARYIAEWLDFQGFTTFATERRYSGHDRRAENEPSLALCGFDKAQPRSFLEKTGFDFIIECGLGSTLSDFDCIDVHTFPGNEISAEERWAHVVDTHKSANEDVLSLFGAKDGKCAQLAIDTAGKAVSTSFVGAMAGALVVAEALKLFNKGDRHYEIIFSPRNMMDSKFKPAHSKISFSKIAQMGFSSL